MHVNGMDESKTLVYDLMEVVDDWSLMITHFLDLPYTTPSGSINPYLDAFMVTCVVCKGHRGAVAHGKFRLCGHATRRNRTLFRKLYNCRLYPLRTMPSI